VSASRTAYRLIGYNDTRHWEALEAYNRWLAINANNAAQLCDRFKKTGAKASLESPTAFVRVSDSVGISFAVARCQRASREHQDPQWLLNCKGGRSPPGWIVALRLQKNNRTVLDHILLPSTSIKGTWLRFMDKTREPRKIEGFETFKDLAQSLVRRVNRAKRSAQMTLPDPRHRDQPKEAVRNEVAAGVRNTRMFESALGHKRRFDGQPITFGLPRSADTCEPVGMF
jgi:hypothetical protein